MQCPYGNVYVLVPGGVPGVSLDDRGAHPSDDQSLGAGLDRVELRCAPGTAPGIARFYRHYFEADVTEGPGAAEIRCGPWQTVRYVESTAPLPAYDGHHMALYLANAESFKGAFLRLKADGIVWVNPRFSDKATTLDGALHEYRQFRLKDIRDPDTGELLHTIEHEVRVGTHPLAPF